MSQALTTSMTRNPSSSRILVGCCQTEIDKPSKVVTGIHTSRRRHCAEYVRVVATRRLRPKPVVQTTGGAYVGGGPWCVSSRFTRRLDPWSIHDLASLSANRTRGPSHVTLCTPNWGDAAVTGAWTLQMRGPLWVSFMGLRGL